MHTDMETLRILNNLFYSENVLTYFPSRAVVSCVSAQEQKVCVCE